MSQEFDRFTQALSATKTSEERERDEQKQSETEKQKIIAANRKKIEDSGVFTLFREIINNNVVKDGFVREGVACTDLYYASLIFNKKSNGNYDFCSIAAYSDNEDPSYPQYRVSNIFAFDFGKFVNYSFPGKSEHENHNEVNKKFNKTIPFDLEGYVAEKITNPDQFITYTSMSDPNLEPYV